jgi:hypothetical protein
MGGFLDQSFIELRWQAKDLSLSIVSPAISAISGSVSKSNAPANGNSGSKGLSSGAKVGIGLGIGLGIPLIVVVISFAFGVSWFLKLRRSKHQQASSPDPVLAPNLSTENVKESKQRDVGDGKLEQGQGRGQDHRQEPGQEPRQEPRDIAKWD